MYVYIRSHLLDPLDWLVQPLGQFWRAINHLIMDHICV